MKKKREKCRGALINKIVIPPEFHSDDTHIENHFNTLEEADTFEKQQSCLITVCLCVIY